jgi:hypothetical protein
MAYFYCLEKVARSDGQLTDVVMPASQVKMDSSVPGYLLSMEPCKLEVECTRKEQGSQLQELQDMRLDECSRLLADLICDDRDFLTGSALTNSTTCLSSADFTTEQDLTTSDVKHLKSPEFDPSSLFDADRQQDIRFQEDLLALEKMLHIPGTGYAALLSGDGHGEKVCASGQGPVPMIPQVN